MGIFFKAERKVRGMITAYLDEVDACMEQFRRGMEFHLQDEGGEALPDGGRTDDLESEADEMRRDIEMTLYGRALLPESRGDILTILESYDRVPNAAETVLSILANQRVVIPAFRVDKVTTETAHADKQRIHTAVGQVCHICGLKYIWISQPLDGAVATVIHHERAAIYLGYYFSLQIICVKIVV